MDQAFPDLEALFLGRFNGNEHDRKQNPAEQRHFLPHSQAKWPVRLHLEVCITDASLEVVLIRRVGVREDQVNRRSVLGDEKVSSKY